MNISEFEEKIVKVFLLVREFYELPDCFCEEQMINIYTNLSDVFSDGKYHNVTYVRSFGQYRFYFDAEEIDIGNCKENLEVIDYNELGLEAIMKDQTITFDMNADFEIPKLINSCSWDYSLTNEEIEVLFEFLTMRANFN